MDSISNIRLQLWILGLVRATEAIAWTSIFPYAYYMIKSFKVPEHDIAFYAGALIGVFTFGEFLGGVFWAAVSDRIGRKPTVLIGAVCGLVAALWLGLSRSVAVAIVSRAFGGLFNPNVGLVQTCMGELARREQQAKAFSLVTFIRSLGYLVGPVIGGLLANPVALYPSMFPPNSFWSHYPYLLPNLSVVLLQILTIFLTFFFLRETHPQMAGRRDLGLETKQRLKNLFYRRGSGAAYVPLAEDPERSLGTHTLEELPNQALAPDSDSNCPEPSQPIANPPTRTFTRQVILQILSISLLAFHKMSTDSIMGTFLALQPPSLPTSANNTTNTTSSLDPNLTSAVNTTDAISPQEASKTGGFGLSTPTIATIFLTEAIFRAVIQPTFIPWFVSRMGGALHAFRVVLGVYPALYIFTPFLPGIRPRWAGMVLLMGELWGRVVVAAVGYVCSGILITNTSPSSQALAKINGAAASLGCLARSVGPLLTGKLFALGLREGYLQIPFWTLGAVAVLGGLEALLLKDYP